MKRNVRPRTLANYRLQVYKHISPALGRIKLKALTAAHVQGFYNAELDAGLAPSTVRYIHAVLHRALEQAIKWKLVAENVTEAVDLPKLEYVEPRILSPKEARAFLRAAHRTIGTRPCSWWPSLPGCDEARSWPCAGRTWGSKPEPCR